VRLRNEEAAAAVLALNETAERGPNIYSAAAQQQERLTATITPGSATPALELTSDVSRAMGLNTTKIDSHTLAMGPNRPGANWKTAVALPGSGGGAAATGAASSAQPAQPWQQHAAAQQQQRAETETDAGYLEAIRQFTKPNGSIEIERMPAPLLALHLNRSFAVAKAAAVAAGVDPRMAARAAAQLQDFVLRGGNLAGVTTQRPQPVVGAAGPALSGAAGSAAARLARGEQAQSGRAAAAAASVNAPPSAPVPAAAQRPAAAATAAAADTAPVEAPAASPAAADTEGPDPLAALSPAAEAGPAAVEAGPAAVEPAAPAGGATVTLADEEEEEEPTAPLRAASAPEEELPGAADEGSESPDTHDRDLLRSLDATDSDPALQFALTAIARALSNPAGFNNGAAGAAAARASSSVGTAGFLSASFGGSAPSSSGMEELPRLSGAAAQSAGHSAAAASGSHLSRGFGAGGSYLGYDDQTAQTHAHTGGFPASAADDGFTQRVALLGLGADEEEEVPVPGSYGAPAALPAVAAAPVPAVSGRAPAPGASSDMYSALSAQDAEEEEEMPLPPALAEARSARLQQQQHRQQPQAQHPRGAAASSSASSGRGPHLHMPGGELEQPVGGRISAGFSMEELAARAQEFRPAAPASHSQAHTSGSLMGLLPGMGPASGAATSSPAATSGGSSGRSGPGAAGAAFPSFGGAAPAAAALGAMMQLTPLRPGLAAPVGAGAAGISAHGSPRTAGTSTTGGTGATLSVHHAPATAAPSAPGAPFDMSALLGASGAMPAGGLAGVGLAASPTLPPALLEALQSNRPMSGSEVAALLMFQQEQMRIQQQQQQQVIMMLLSRVAGTDPSQGGLVSAAAPFPGAGFGAGAAPAASADPLAALMASMGASACSPGLPPQAPGWPLGGMPAPQSSPTSGADAAGGRRGPPGLPGPAGRY
jgi:hypothetical protein